MTPLRCDRVGCSGEGRWLPVLMVRAPYRARNSTPAPCILSLAICDVHKETGSVDDFLSDGGWTQIVEGFATLGKVPPARERTTLEWRALDDPEPMVRTWVERARVRQGLEL